MRKQEFYMQKCLDLACKGKGNVSPNPMVGSVIVYNDEIIGKGYHEKYGCSHAEVNAINSVKKKYLLNESTLYVNLEPCAHFGKTPPCSDLIIKYKIPKVIIGCIDTFSNVSGRGVKKMKNAGIKVVVGVLEEQCREINKRFFTFHEKKRPYIILKWAESQDKFIAPLNQSEPFWMTSNKSKHIVHKWRSQEDAILVGRITAQKDNPLLTVRNVVGNNPIRIVIDNDLTLSKDLKLFNNDSYTIIINNIKSYTESKNKYVKISNKNFIINILNYLYKQNIQSFIIEGGSITLQSFINDNLWDEARVFTTKKHLKKGVPSPIIAGRLNEERKVEDDNLKIFNND